MGIVVFGAVFVDVKGYPLAPYIPGGRNVGRVLQVHGGVSRNVAEDFQRIYGVVPKAFALSIIGNSQYTRSNTIAEVDYIEFVPAESSAQK